MAHMAFHTAFFLGDGERAERLNGEEVRQIRALFGERSRGGGREGFLGRTWHWGIRGPLQPRFLRSCELALLDIREIDRYWRRKKRIK